MIGCKSPVERRGRTRDTVALACSRTVRLEWVMPLTDTGSRGAGIKPGLHGMPNKMAAEEWSYSVPESPTKH